MGDSGGGGSGKSREEEVKDKLQKDLMPMLPPDYVELEIREKLKVTKGPKGLGEPGKMDLVPLNIFLGQELQRFGTILSIVKGTMAAMCDAIDGTISMTPDIVDSINAVFDFRVPRKFQYDPTGAEISWLTASLSGFFNPQGFLTAMKQEVTRQKKTWSLDEVEYSSDVLKEIIQGEDGRIEGKSINHPQEGVHGHGLFLEGAGWNRSEKRLEESQPKELYYQFPILHVSAISTAVDPKAAPGAGARGKTDLANLAKTSYYCPVYVYPKRNDRYLIFRCYLKAEAPGAP